jgi:hypothetical protein
MTDGSLGIQLRADDRAAVFSEELYQQVRAEKLKEWLADQRENLEEAYDEAAERQSFAEFHSRELEEFQTRTPAQILAKVADIRVLALGLCTEEVYRDFEEYWAQCEKQTVKTMEEAWNMQKAQGLDKVWTGGHSLHDSLVQSVKREGEDLVIEFDRENDPELLEELGEVVFLFPEIKAIRFRDAEILKQEGPVEKAWWLYDEIWKTEEGAFEIHALLWRNEDLLELTIECRDTELVWTMEPKAE